MWSLFLEIESIKYFVRLILPSLSISYWNRRMSGWDENVVIFPISVDVRIKAGGAYLKVNNGFTLAS